jgi:hypothetical protein
VEGRGREGRGGDVYLCTLDLGHAWILEGGGYIFILYYSFQAARSSPHMALCLAPTNALLRIGILYLYYIFLPLAL